MLAPEKVILLLGSPRSGTSWIGKIFDSHPDVIYRHEPDIQRRGGVIPHTCNDAGQYVDAARAYAQQLVNARDIRSIGHLPVFSKPYRPEALSYLRKAYIHFLRVGASSLKPLESWPVPDFIGDAKPRIVIKSVSALGRAGLFALALPDARIIHILRHPCGHVGSVLRGQKSNKMQQFPLGFEVADVAAHYNISRAKLETMPLIAQAAWRWVLLNHKAMHDVQGKAASMTLVYEDLCADPIAISQQLFAFTGLDWRRETEVFLGQTTASHKGEDYFGIKRDPLTAALQWRKELSRDEIRTIADIVRDTPPGRLFSYD